MTVRYKYSTLRNVTPGIIFIIIIISITFFPVMGVKPSYAEDSLVRPNKKTSEPKYKIKVRPIKITPLEKKTTGSSSSKNNGASLTGKPGNRRPASGKTVFKGMIKNKSSETVAGKTKPKASISISEKKNPIKPLKVKPNRDKNKIHQTEGIAAKPIGKIERVEEKYEIKVSPTANISSLKGKTVPASPGSKIKVTRVRSWKLDASGKRTNEIISDETKIIGSVVNRRPIKKPPNYVLPISL